MAQRSTTSQFQPIPPNYSTPSGPYHNIGRYQEVNRNSVGPNRANMCTAPTTSVNSQYRYIPRLNG